MRGRFIELDGDGEFHPEFRNHARTRHIPIVALAALAKPEDDTASRL